jgi:single-stranded DNA-binding protein
LQTRSWEGQDGQTRSRTEVVATTMVMLDAKGHTDEGGGDYAREQVREREPAMAGAAPARRRGSAAPAPALDEDDLPF